MSLEPCSMHIDTHINSPIFSVDVETIYFINSHAGTMRPDVATAWAINDRFWHRIEKGNLVSIRVRKKLHVTDA